MKQYLTVLVELKVQKRFRLFTCTHQIPRSTTFDKYFQYYEV